MNRGRVYLWIQDPTHPLHGRVSEEVVSLSNLDTEREGSEGLWGRYVRVRNASCVNDVDLTTGKVRPAPLGDAQPDAQGDFLYDPGGGGPRVDKVELHPSRSRYVGAAHFGEVNTYYHLDHIASYVHELLAELGTPPLPRVTAVVNAHNGATWKSEGVCDGLLRGETWVPFQGGHYRLPSWKYDIPEHDLVSPDGEIHLGPGRRLWQYGALAEHSGTKYRAIASHDAGILYHEYGHHIVRHTADFRANALRPRDKQSNRKIDMDEGTCDYWAATVLGTPHIWAWHQRHDDEVVHPRSLTSSKTMADFDHDKEADPHLNGTIWGAALWDLRANLSASEPNGARRTDLLLLQALLLIGRLMGDDNPPAVESASRAREGFAVGMSALLQADEMLFESRHRALIMNLFKGRGISQK